MYRFKFKLQAVENTKTVSIDIDILGRYNGTVTVSSDEAKRFAHKLIEMAEYAGSGQVMAIEESFEF